MFVVVFTRYSLPSLSQGLLALPLPAAIKRTRVLAVREVVFPSETTHVQSLISTSFVVFVSVPAKIIDHGTSLSQHINMFTHARSKNR